MTYMIYFINYVLCHSQKEKVNSIYHKSDRIQVEKMPVLNLIIPGNEVDPEEIKRNRVP